MRNKSIDSVVWGFVLIALGVGFFLNSMGIMNFGQFFGTYWPVILLIIAVSEFIKGKFNSALIWAIIGIAFLLSSTKIINASAWDIIWPAIIIVIGLSILLKSSRRTETRAEKGESVSATAAFSGNEKRVDSSNFRLGDINAIFGGVKIDLRKANIAKEGALIDALILFGGGEILLPKDTPIKLETFAAFGGVDDKRSQDKIDKNKKPVVIRGTVLFGGLEIKD